MSLTDLPPNEHERSPFELESATTTPARPPERAGHVEGLTITEAASLFGVSISTIRRLLKAGVLAGAVKVPSPKGVEHRIPPAALEARGYKRQGSLVGAVLNAAQANAQAEQLAVKVRELEAALELERARREAAENESRLLERSLSDLREALSRLPAALPVGVRRRRFFRKLSE